MPWKETRNNEIPANRQTVLLFLGIRDDRPTYTVSVYGGPRKCFPIYGELSYYEIILERGDNAIWTELPDPPPPPTV
jgi:hypothetical protein